MVSWTAIREREREGPPALGCGRQRDVVITNRPDEPDLGVQRAKDGHTHESVL